MAALPADTSFGPPAVTVLGRRTILDFLFFLRPVLLVPVWTIALLGVVASGRGVGWSAGYWVIFFLHLSCLFGAVYTLNQICDIESDRINRKLFFLTEGIISVRAAWAFTLALNAAALGLSLIFGLWHLALTLAVITLGIVYSIGARPWKNRPLLGFVANAVGHGPLVWLLGSSAVTDSLRLWVSSVPYLAAVGAAYLATTVPDADGDRASGKRTAAVVLGARWTMLAATLLVLGAIPWAAWRHDYYLAVSAAASLPFFARALWRGAPWATGAAKAGVGFLSLAAVVVFPIYLVVLVAGFIGTRLFFRWRFGMTYPSLHARTQTRG